MAKPARKVNNPVWYILPILFFTTGGTSFEISERKRYRVRTAVQTISVAKTTWWYTGFRYTAYEMGKSVLKATRRTTPRPPLNPNPFRESDNMKSEYDATMTIGSSSASCAPYNRDAWKIKLPTPITATPYERFRDEMNPSIDDLRPNEVKARQTKNPSGYWIGSFCCKATYPP